jgi:hypothetical protein
MRRIIDVVDDHLKPFKIEEKVGGSLLFIWLLFVLLLFI